MARRIVLVCLAAAVLIALVWLAARNRPSAIDAQRAAHAPTQERDEPDLAAPTELDRVAAPSSETQRAEAIVDDAETADEPRVVVVVLDPERKPIAGAHVSTFDDTITDSFDADASGRVVLPLVAPDSTKTAKLFVEAPGFFHVKAFYRCDPEIQVLLARSATLRGRVLEKGTERTIAGAHIEHPHSFCKHCAPDRRTSDAGGRYEIEGIPIGRDATFVLSANGFPSQSERVRLGGMEAIIERDFVLDRGVEIVGDVVDFTTSAPIAAARIENEGRVLARTGADGRFATRAVPVRSTGRIDLRIGADEYCWLRNDWLPEELGPDHPLRVPLPRGVSVEATVRDEAGVPVTAFDLIIHADIGQLAIAQSKHELGALSELTRAWRIESEKYENTYRTDDAGCVRTRGLVPFAPDVKLWAKPTERGWIAEQTIALGGPGETARVDLVLRKEAHGTIAGRVLLNGKPVSGYVSWQGATRRGGASADGAGRFVLDFVEPGSVVVTTHRGQYTTALAHEDTIDVAAGARVERDFDLVIAMAPIAGRVVRFDQRSPAQLTVLVQEWPRGSGHRQTARTDDEGRFAIEVPGSDAVYRGIVYVDDHPFMRDGIRPGDTNVEIVISEVPTVLCRALDARTREPIARVDVFGRASVTDRFERVTDPIEGADADGWMRVRIPSGTWELHARAGKLGYAPCTRDAVTVAARGETRIELEMTRGATLELRLADGAQPWDASYRVVLLDAEVAESLDAFAEPPKSFADANPRHPGIDPGLDRGIDFAGRDVALVRGLVPGRYRLYEARRLLAFEPELIEVPTEELASVAIGWRRR